MPEKSEKWSVRVYGSDYLKGPILDTDDAKIVAFLDTNGVVQAAMVRIDDTKFIFGSAGEEDWDNFKRRFGL